MTSPARALPGRSRQANAEPAASAARRRLAGPASLRGPACREGRGPDVDVLPVQVEPWARVLACPVAARRRAAGSSPRRGQLVASGQEVT